MSAQQDIIIERCRDWARTYIKPTDGGNFLNMTGYIINMTIKRSTSDPDSAAIYHAAAPTSSNLPFGMWTFLIPHSVTSGFSASTSGAVYDISTVAPDNIWTTEVSGAATFINPVTITIA